MHKRIPLSASTIRVDMVISPHLAHASEGADKLIQKADQQVDPTMGDARAALEAIRQVMDQADRTLRTIDLLAEGYAERSAFHYEVSIALKEIAAAASSLRALTDLLQQQPDALIRGKGEPGGS